MFTFATIARVQPKAMACLFVYFVEDDSHGGKLHTCTFISRVKPCFVFLQ